MNEQEAVRLEVELRNRDGLHARPVSRIVEIANRFAADFTIIKEETEVDGRSVLQLLTLAAPKGTRLILVAIGEDADKLVASIRDEIDRGFGEPID